jgi:hypothetical protein
MSIKVTYLLNSKLLICLDLDLTGFLSSLLRDKGDLYISFL